MKTRFTLTFTVDLPYPNKEAYPGCSTPDEAVKVEIEQFKNDSILWLEVMLSNPIDLNLEGRVDERI